MKDSVIFRKFGGEKIPHVDEYIEKYMETHKNIEILVGTDSQIRGGEIIYSTVIALYTPGHGAHCIFKKWREPRLRAKPGSTPEERQKRLEEERRNRLTNEVWASIACAEELKQRGIKSVKYIDIDINPNPKYKSSEVFASARGMVEGMGYGVRDKDNAPLVTTMADYLVKH